jgi:hypothetical protein
LAPPTPRIPTAWGKYVEGRRGPARAGVAAFSLFLALPLTQTGCHRARMPPRLDGAAVVVVAESTAEPGFAVSDEVEPNDLLANAQALTPTGALAVGIVGHLVSASGAKAKDVDLYRITVPPPAVVTTDADGGSTTPRQRLAIEVRPDPGLVISVDAMDDQGKVLVAAIGMTPGETEGIPNLAVTPGTYLVRVKPGMPGVAGPAATVGNLGGGGTASRIDGGIAGVSGTAYRLTTKLFPFEAGDEVEPNGRGALANEVAPGADVAGFLAWRHDEDWFRLPLNGLPEGSVLSVDLDPPDGVAVSIAVLDSVEHKMTEQRGRKGDRVAIRNVRLPSSEPNMFVVVRAEAGQNLAARYTLRLRTEEARADAELEPNDDPAHAVPFGDGNFVGFLGPGDVDVYRYIAATPVELDFEATPPERVDLKLEVIREDGTALTRTDVGKRREAERLPNLYVSGSLLLRLSAGKGDGNLDEPYRIHASSRPAEPGNEREPNDTTALATTLSAGVTGAGLCFPRGDIDRWLAQAPVAVGGSLAISVRPVPGLTLDVRVQSITGKDLTRFRVGGDASAPTRVNPGSDGCCSIQIREASGRGANPRDRYSLSVVP